MTPDNRNSEPLDAILRRATRAQAGPATPECADAESLAAYSDRSAPTAERERLEAHFADCMRCQMLLADIARAEESARGAKAATEVPWYRRWGVAIPALAALAAVLVFIAIRRPANEERQSEQIAMEKREAPMELAERAPAPAPASPAAESASAPAAPAPAPAAPSSNEIAMNEKPPEAARRAEAMSGGAALHRMESNAAVPGARAMVAQGNEAAAKSNSIQSFSGSVAGRAAVPNAGYAEQAGVLATISPSDRSVTWVVGKNGTIERLDANGNRHTEQSGVSSDLVAGAAPSSSVCWVVGRDGTILRTTDGVHWERIAAPTAENLVAVSSGSARDAIVTTSSSKSFVTSDGGASWHRQ